MAIFQQGMLNTTALSVPDIYIQIVPPQIANLNGVPTNIGAFVGTASWGPVGVAQSFSDLSSYSQIFGPLVARRYDMGTWAAIAAQQGNAGIYYGVRCTDGTDAAATAVLVSGCVQLSAKYTGSLGNTLTGQLFTGNAANSFKLVLTLPGYRVETFDNISSGITNVTVTAGTGYTSVPTLTVGAPPAGGTQAVLQPTLTVVSYTLGVGGTGYVVGDQITLANGVVLTVATVSATAVATVTITKGGSLAGGNVPTNPVSQLSTTGAGSGATFNLTWGMGTPVITTPGTGYASAPTITINGGGGSGGSYTALISIWANLVNAVNLGNGAAFPPSQLVTATNLGGSTAAAAQNNPVAFTGGQDGAGVGTSQLLGSDVTPRKGMYALRGLNIACAALVDCYDSTSYASQVAFGAAESIEMFDSTPPGDTPSNAVSTRTTGGIDNFDFHLMLGDFITWKDTVSGLSRVVSPVPFMIGRRANLAPHIDTLNKAVFGVVGTQRSQTGLPYSQAELQTLSTGGIDVICNPVPGGNFFGIRVGQNTSSNPLTRDDNYTQLTNYIAKTLNAGMGRFVGMNQGYSDPDDTRMAAKITIDAFMANLKFAKMIDSWTVILDQTNNPVSMVALGYMQALVQVVYLRTVRYFVINLQGGAVPQAKLLAEIAAVNQ